MYFSSQENLSAMHRWGTRSVLFSKRWANWRFAVDFGKWLLHLVVVAFANLGHTSLSVETLSYDFIGLDKLVDLSGELIVLVTDDSNVTIHGVDLDLEIGIVLDESRVWIACSFKLFAHVHELVFLLPDLGFKLLDGSGKFNILAAFVVDAALQVPIFFFVASL